MVDPIIPGNQGKAINPQNTVTKINQGAILKSTLSDAVGMMSSFCKSFIKSATVWSNPLGPTSSGPKRSCTKAAAFRSAYTISTAYSSITVSVIKKAQMNI